MQAPPKQIKLHKRTQTLEVVFSDAVFELPAEFLRVHSPSAEVKGHGPGQEILQLNKQDVYIVSVAGQGNYAIKIIFSDGHDSGIYTWEYLYTIGQNQHALWQKYLHDVEKHKESKDTSTVKWV